MSYADVNGLSLWYSSQGEGPPLILLHGGIAGSEVFDGIAPQLAAGPRRVITVDLEGHGRTAHLDRPLRQDLLADDVAALIEHLGLERADVLGYSLGGEVALRLAIQHPELVHRLVLISIAVRRDGWFPEVVATMDAMTADVAEGMRQSPAFRHYERVAPRPEDWTAHIARTAEALKVDFDWTAETGAVKAPALLVYADADAILPAHVAEIYALFGGGLGDPGWDGSGRPTARLAVLPGRTHYDLLQSPLLVPAVADFLG